MALVVDPTSGAVYDDGLPPGGVGAPNDPNALPGYGAADMAGAGFPVEPPQGALGPSFAAFGNVPPPLAPDLAGVPQPGPLDAPQGLAGMSEGPAAQPLPPGLVAGADGTGAQINPQEFDRLSQSDRISVGMSQQGFDPNLASAVTSFQQSRGGDPAKMLLGMEGVGAELAARQSDRALFSLNQASDAQAADRDLAVQMATAQYEADVAHQKALSAHTANVINADKEARADSQAARARYEASLNAVRNMVIDPAKAYKDMGSAGAFAAIGLFAQGFLAAQGPGQSIKLDVAGALNQVIDRSIMLQQEAISRGERMAEGDKALWDMARTEAVDEMDALNRYKGMLVEAYSANSAVIASKFSGDRARVTYQKQQADLARTHLEIQTSIEQAAYKSAFESRKAFADQVNTEAQLAIGRTSANASASQAKTARMREQREATAGAPYKPKPGLFKQDGTLVGVFAPHVAPAEATNLQKRQGMIDRFDTAVSELQAIEDGSYQGPGAGNLNETNRRKAALRAEMDLTLKEISNLGAALTPTELDLVQKRRPADGWTTLGSTGAELYNLRRTVQGRHDNELQTGVVLTPTADDQAYYAQNPIVRQSARDEKNLQTEIGRDISGSRDKEQSAADVVIGKTTRTDTADRYADPATIEYIDKALGTSNATKNADRVANGLEPVFYPAENLSALVDAGDRYRKAAAAGDTETANKYLAAVVAHAQGPAGGNAPAEGPYPTLSPDDTNAQAQALAQRILYDSGVSVERLPRNYLDQYVTAVRPRSDQGMPTLREPGTE